MHLSADAYVPEGLFEPVAEEDRPEIVEIIFSDGTEKVEYFATYSTFTYLCKVTIPSSIQFISARAFFGCTDLETVMLD